MDFHKRMVIATDENLEYLVAELYYNGQIWATVNPIKENCLLFTFWIYNNLGNRSPKPDLLEFDYIIPAMLRAKDELKIEIDSSSRDDIKVKGIDDLDIKNIKFKNQNTALLYSRGEIWAEASKEDGKVSLRIEYPSLDEKNWVFELDSLINFLTFINKAMTK